MRKRIWLLAPTDNAEIEPYHRTINERLNDLETADFATPSRPTTLEQGNHSLIEMQKCLIDA